MKCRDNTPTASELTDKARRSLVFVIASGVIGLVGSLALFALGIVADENSGIMLAAILLGLTTLMSLSAAIRLRNNLARRKTEGRLLLLYTSGINLLVFGIPILVATYAATVFGFGIASQDSGLTFGLSLVVMAALGVLFFITHISALRIAWNLKPQR